MAENFIPHELEDQDEAVSAEPLQLEILVGEAQANKRLDQFLTAQLKEVSRSQLQQWIEQGHVVVNGQPSKPSQKLKEGQSVTVVPPPAQPVNDWVAEPMPLDIVFEDDEIIVINKPVGLVVHPAAGHPSGTLVNGLLAYCPSMGTVARCGIVHRLDRDTSGLMVAAKTVAAQLNLVSQLAARTVSRQYLALAWGRVEDQTLDTPMGRDAKDRQRMAVLAAGKGKQAITHLQAIDEGSIGGLPVTLVRCRLETGRTHQIRVHLEHIRRPIVGDRTYTRHAPHASRLGAHHKTISDLMSGQALHAQRLSFLHPKTNKKSSFISELPANYKKLIELADIYFNSAE